MKNPLSPQEPMPIQEHHISIGGGIVELEFNYATKTVFMIDQTGSTNMSALNELTDWYAKKGWFLHIIAVGPSTILHEEDVRKEEG